MTAGRDVAKRTVLTVLSRARRTQGVARFRALTSATDAAVCVNIGAGKDRLPGWVNTDIHWQAESYLDLLQPWPDVVRGRVHRIYADNVIEHFRIPATRVLLRHAYDALGPDGAIRLATPDVEAAAREYMARSPLGRDHLARHTDAGYDIYHDVDLLRVVFAESGHHAGYCYDFEALASELARAGFTDITRVRSGESSRAEFRGLENRAGPTDQTMMLVVEAAKSPAGTIADPPKEEIVL